VGGRLSAGGGGEGGGDDSRALARGQLCAHALVMLDIIHDELHQQSRVHQLRGDDVVGNVVVDARVLLDVPAQSVTKKSCSRLHGTHSAMIQKQPSRMRETKRAAM